MIVKKKKPKEIGSLKIENNLSNKIKWRGYFLS